MLVPISSEKGRWYDTSSGEHASNHKSISSLIMNPFFYVHWLIVRWASILRAFFPAVEVEAWMIKWRRNRIRDYLLAWLVLPIETVQVKAHYSNPSWYRHNMFWYLLRQTRKERAWGLRRRKKKKERIGLGSGGTKPTPFPHRPTMIASSGHDYPARAIILPTVHTVHIHTV